MTHPAPGDRVVVVQTETSGQWFGSGTPGQPGPPGPPGPQGPPGASTSLFTYQYQSQATPPPPNGFIRTDGATASTSSIFYVAKIDSNGIDNTLSFVNGQVGDVLYAQQSNDATCWARWTLSAAPVDNGTYITLQVSFLSQGPTPLTGNKPSMQVGILRASGGGPNSYHYVQSTSATSWHIVHNLGFWPNVSCVDTTGREIIPEVTYNSVNDLTLTFSPDTPGEAYLS